MTTDSSIPTVAPSDEPADINYDDAARLVVRQQRKEAVNRLADLRRQADAAKERAAVAQRRFEKAVAMMASDRPEREDWYEHPGSLPRKTLLAAGKLNTMTLHRIMERYRRGVKAPKRPARRVAK